MFDYIKAVLLIDELPTSYQRVTNELPTSYRLEQYDVYYAITSYHELPSKYKKIDINFLNFIFSGNSW